eukprot:3014093-Pyramimonas_sp.AAC.1
MQRAKRLTLRAVRAPAARAPQKKMQRARRLTSRPQERDDGAHAVVGDRPHDAIGLRDPLGVVRAGAMTGAAAAGCIISSTLGIARTCAFVLSARTIEEHS